MLQQFHLEKRSLERNFINVYKQLKEGHEEKEARIFSAVPTERKTGSGHKQDLPSEYETSGIDNKSLLEK